MASITREEAAHRYCDLCYRQIQLGLVPCPGCAEVAYCSAQCQEKAFGRISSSPFLPSSHFIFPASYHKFECGRRHLFGKILENSKKAGGRNRIGSTIEFSKLCFRVSSTCIVGVSHDYCYPGHCQVPRLLVQGQSQVSLREVADVR